MFKYLFNISISRGYMSNGLSHQHVKRNKRNNKRICFLNLNKKKTWKNTIITVSYEVINEKVGWK